MWSAAVLALVISQADAIKVAAPSFTLVGLAPELGNVFQDRFVSRLAASELRITTQRDIEQLLGLERQRQLLGCGETSSSCLAELAGALGVDVVVSGNVARSDSGFIASVRALRTSDGEIIDSPTTRVASEAELLDWLDKAAEGVREKIIAKFRPATTSAIVRWIPGLAGGAFLIGGAICLISSGTAYGQLVGPTPLTDIAGTRARGETLMPLGLTFVGVGVAGLATSIIWSLIPSPVKVALVPLRDGGVFAFGGAFP